MSEGVCARAACPELRAGCLLQDTQSPSVIGVWLRVQKHFDVFDVEAELRYARHDHRRGCGITAVEHNVSFRPRDQEGSGIGRTDIVKIPGDAEWLGGALPSALVCVQPPANYYQRNDKRQY